MIAYWNSNSDKMIQLTIEHAQMVLSAMAIALVITIILVLFFINKKNIMNGLVYFFSLLYSVPSYAFFALLIPITGLGKTSAIIVLTLYIEYVLLRNFITGIDEVDPNYIEVAHGMGMTEKQIFLKVQLPLSMPAIFSGIRVALASSMAIATIASSISAGGLGDLIFDGLQTGRIVPILWGTILTIALSLICMLIIKLLENILIGDWQS